MRLRLLIVSAILFLWGWSLWVGSNRFGRDVELRPVDRPGRYGIDGTFEPGQWVPGPPDASGGDRPTFVPE